MDFRKMIRVQIRIAGNKRVKGIPLSQAILEVCRQESILGATVTRCEFGYGEHDYKPHILRNMTDLPEIVEIVDEPTEIMNLLPKLKEVVDDNGLITLEEVLTV